MSTAVVVHVIQLGDVDDPDLWVADPIYQWQQTDAGTFAMEKSIKTPVWMRDNNPTHYGHTYKIVAYFDDTTVTYWKLKFT